MQFCKKFFLFIMKNIKTKKNIIQHPTTGHYSLLVWFYFPWHFIKAFLNVSFYGSRKLHPTFFILICYTLCFTPYPFHPWYFISLISSLVFSSPGYHPIPFPTQLAKIPFHPNLFIPIKDIYYFILAFFILKIERMTCTGWKRRVKSVNMKLIRWKT